MTAERSCRLVAALLVVAALAAATEATPQTARAAYEQARARERQLRATGAGGSIPVDALPALIAAYERLVRRYPTSPYSDDALWRAAELARELSERRGTAADRDRAASLLRWLVREYPASSLAPRARLKLQSLATSAPTSAAAASSRSAPPAAPPAATPQAAHSSPVLVRDIQHIALPAVARVIIVLDGAVSFHHQQLSDPDRVFFDLVGTEPAAHLINARWSFPGDLVQEIRVGRHPQHTTRVVLTLDRLARYTVFTLTDPHRVLVDFERERPASLPAAPALAGGTAAPPSPEPAAASPSAAPPPAPKPLDATPAARGLSLPRPPAANLSGKLSLARQLGLGVGRIVIDPGHGGHDPGAQAHGVSEAAIVLDVALRLEALLRRQTDMEVILTRRTDVFVPLEERTALANREEADLFLSIHANASPSRTTRGVETYFLNFATNPEAEAVAARENAPSGQPMRRLPELLKAIALNAKLDESRDLATLVQRSLVRRLRPANRALQDLGVKQAPFVVLIGAAMPSVLAEIAFVTNPTEARLLKAAAYRQRIAEALADAVVRYQRTLKAVATVAEQR